MRTVKFKLANGVTLANPYAPLGETPSGAVIFEVTDVPDDVTNVQLRIEYLGYFAPFFGKGLSVKYAK